METETIGPPVLGHAGEESSRFIQPIELAAVLQALSDPIRLRIVAVLADGQEYSCGSFELPITKSTCSHHFRVLREAGVIETRIDGKNRLNRLRRHDLDAQFPGLLEAVLRANAA